MKERPILFSAPMVRTLLAGTKSQTRRLVKPQPPATGGNGGVLQGIVPSLLVANRGQMFDVRYALDNPMAISCQYGAPGDQLWVREAWRAGAMNDLDAPRNLYARTTPIHHEADGPANDRLGFGKYRSGRFMPRWASRITLEMTGVRVERLQGISEEDAKAEGAWGSDDSIVGKVAEHFGCDALSVHPSLAFRMLWEQINGPDSWAANPWVWVVEFKRIEQGGAA